MYTGWQSIHSQRYHLTGVRSTVPRVRVWYVFEHSLITIVRLLPIVQYSRAYGKVGYTQQYATINHPIGSRRAVRIVRLLPIVQ